MRICLTLFAALLIWACSTKTEPELTPEEEAQEAAEIYYTALHEGRYKTFLDGMSNAKSMPLSYRKAMTNNLKQHVAKTKCLHRGVDHIEPTRTQMDSSLQLMQVFLLVHYRDSMQEEIVVPMVETANGWRMK